MRTRRGRRQLGFRCLWLKLLSNYRRKVRKDRVVNRWNFNVMSAASEIISGRMIRAETKNKTEKERERKGRFDKQREREKVGLINRHSLVNRTWRVRKERCESLFSANAARTSFFQIVLCERIVHLVVCCLSLDVGGVSILRAEPLHDFLTIYPQLPPTPRHHHPPPPSPPRRRPFPYSSNVKVIRDDQLFFVATSLLMQRSLDTELCGYSVALAKWQESGCFTFAIWHSPERKRNEFNPRTKKHEKNDLLSGLFWRMKNT